jgi:hypothetical protein
MEQRTTLHVMAEHPGAYEELQEAFAEAAATGDTTFDPDIWFAIYLAKKAGAYDA